jgi:hypothetical protein
LEFKHGKNTSMKAGPDAKKPRDAARPFLRLAPLEHFTSRLCGVAEKALYF